MALNPVLGQNQNAKNELFPYPYAHECFLLSRDGVTVTFSHNNRKLKGSGKVFLTNRRLVFLRDGQPAKHKDFTSVEFPLDLLENSENGGSPEFHQPIFGANYLEGRVRPLETAELPLSSPTEWRLIFNKGGCNTFLRLFYSVLKRAVQNPNNTAVDPALQQELHLGTQAAFSDPSDPSTLYLTQPVPNGPPLVPPQEANPSMSTTSTSSTPASPVPGYDQLAGQGVPAPTPPPTPPQTACGVQEAAPLLGAQNTGGPMPLTGAPVPCSGGPVSFPRGPMPFPGGPGGPVPLPRGPLPPSGMAFYSPMAYSVPTMPNAGGIPVVYSPCPPGPVPIAPYGYVVYAAPPPIGAPPPAFGSAPPAFGSAPLQQSSQPFPAPGAAPLQQEVANSSSVESTAAAPQAHGEDSNAPAREASAASGEQNRSSEPTSPTATASESDSARPSNPSGKYISHYPPLRYY